MNNVSRLLTEHLFRKSWLLASAVLLLATVVSGVIIAFPRSKAAHAIPVTTPILKVFPSNGQMYFSNTKLRVQGANYPAGETATVYWNYKDASDSGVAEGSATVDSSGTFSVSFPMPLYPTATYTIAGITSSSNAIATTTFQILPNLYTLPRASGVGSHFTLTGQAFGARETVNIYWNCTSSCTGTPLATAIGDATGSFQVTARIPSNATPGKHPMLGIGQTSNTSATAKIIVYPPTLALAPLSGSAGTQLSISAYGFQSNEKVNAYWNNGSSPMFSTLTTANGYVPIKVFSVPVGTPPGSYQVKIVGTKSQLKISNTFTVVAPSSSLSVSSGPIGARVRVSGQGYKPGETVNIYWDYGNPGAKNVASAIQTSLSGSFHVSFLVPTNTNGTYTANGAYPVAAVGASSKIVSQPNTFTVTSGLAASPTSFAPGQSTNVAGSGFQANETVNFYWDSTSGTALSSVAADGHGNINQAVTIPARATPCPNATACHSIIGVGQLSGTSFNTAVTVDTPWNDFGFGPDHLRENPSENILNSSTVRNLSTTQAKWSAGIGSPQPEGAPSPVYYNGLVYIATFDGNLKAYNATTGAPRWQFPTGTNFANLSSPVIDPATNILFFGTLGFLEQQDHGVPSPSFALDAQTGALLWSQIIPGDEYAFPTVAFNTIYVGLANEGGGSLLALDETTGYLNWQYHTNGGTWGAVGVDVKTNTIFTGVGNPGDQVLSLNATTGALNWQQAIVSPGSDDDVGSAMAVANGMVYVDSKNGTMYALDENTGAILWQSPIGGNSQGNVSSPAVGANGVLYVGSLNGNLYALNALNGSLIWKAKTGGAIYSSPALANGVVYVASNDGKIYAFDGTSGIPKWSYNTNQPTFSSPIIINGWLYCASTDGNLYAFSL